MEGGSFFQPFTDIAQLQREMEDMDDATQRRFMRRLSMETHVTLHQHIEDEQRYKSKVDALHAALFRTDAHGRQVSKIDEVHGALFDPMNGLVNMKRWMCRLATGGVAFIVALGAIIMYVVNLGHTLGRW